MCFLNGCIQNSAFLGPVITVASTGSVHNAGLSYASSKTITKVTGKTPVENIKSFLEKDMNEEKNNENSDNFFNIVKSINKSSGIKILANR